MRTLLAEVRIHQGLEPDPIAAFRASGYTERVRTNGLSAPRSAAIPARKAGLITLFRREKTIFDHEGFNTMTNIPTPTMLVQLVARSRKLGADRSVCNWGGGKTSAKSDEIDFRGRPARILWVKGSGSDLATVTDASFTGLYLEDVLPLLERERMSDTEMVDYLAHCFFEPGRPVPP